MIWVITRCLVLEIPFRAGRRDLEFGGGEPVGGWDSVIFTGGPLGGKSLKWYLKLGGSSLKWCLKLGGSSLNLAGDSLKGYLTLGIKAPGYRGQGASQLAGETWSFPPRGTFGGRSLEGCRT